MKRVCVLLASLALSAGVAQGQTVDEIIALNLKAKGGIEKLKATNSVKMTGRVAAQGMEVPMTVWAKRPNLFRQEMSVLGQSMVSGFDGKVLWVMAPGAPAREVSDAPPAAKQDAEFDSVFIDYRDKGVEIELVGKEPVDGKDTYHLKVTRKDGSIQHYFLDTETGLEKRMTTTVEQNGMKLAAERLLSDYRSIEGRMMPFRTRQIVNGATALEMTIDKVEFNVPIEDAMFKMLAK